MSSPLNIDTLLAIACSRGASDLHIKAGSYPFMRVNGELLPITDAQRLTQEDTLAMAFSIMNNRQKQRFKDYCEVDIAYGVSGLGRFRCNIFQQRGAVGMVLRVIPTAVRSIDELQLPASIERISDERRGLILVTGTTGSGKSTTLAAVIDHINRSRTEHIITIEDPIEFLHRDKKSFVNQREVDVDTRSFQEALRGALRQDPDVILVGEVRDHDTAEMAFRAAMTGHQVFSTLHTNSAIQSIPRLLDLNIKTNVLAGNVIGIVAQRLVRTLCPKCKKPEAPSEVEAKLLGLAAGDPLSVYRPVGCAACDFLGYKGRMAIFELLKFDKGLDELITKNASVNAMGDYAVSRGFISMAEDGLRRVRDGLTTVDEVSRVVDLTEAFS